MYPSGMNLYRASRGIKKPVTEKMSYADAKKIVGSGEANYRRTIDLSRDGKPVNTITYEQYNLKRDNNQMQKLHRGKTDDKTAKKFSRWPTKSLNNNRS
jgi:hypothetical protein